ncbi:hypothetical protein LNKW23_40880 [Paralimibaculum aggregatum]|uniref:Lysine transporter LysE n=1 Tax=Paralimibaculum aggregatum TaxID=3036245 RepID=A0ABQ6LNS5_9RHOB|nr:LysE family transporter [Limibaculum sp. NKW23]GMG84872.1 hypothetical protein LNKW23_40880 [Limibaculum sp. NKW23]
MPWTEILAAWAVFGANILSPGPNVFNTIAISLGAGRRAALAIVAAIAIGVACWAAAALLGAAVAFRRLPLLEPLLGCLGGALLLRFAWRYLCRARAWQASVGPAREISPREAFLTTLAVLATNPKALTTWLVLISIFPAGTASPGAIAVMIAGSVAVASLGHLAYALAFSTRAAARAYARIGHWILAGVALFFASLGTGLLWRNLPLLVGGAGQG